jgi:hypothetical protein
MQKAFKLALVLFFFSIVGALSQETKAKLPDQIWGVGVEIQKEDIFGGTLAYALNPDMHIGLNFGFLFDGGAEGSGSSTYLTFGPFFKYFLTQWKVRSFYPFVKAQFLVSTESVSYMDPFTNKTKRRNETQTKLIGFFGSEWFPISSLGIYGGLRVVELQFDPTRFIIGLGNVTIGLEWFVF